MSIAVLYWWHMKKLDLIKRGLHLFLQAVTGTPISPFELVDKFKQYARRNRGLSLFFQAVTGTPISPFELVDKFKQYARRNRCASPRLLVNIFSAALFLIIMAIPAFAQDTSTDSDDSEDTKTIEDAIEEEYTLVTTPSIIDRVKTIEGNLLAVVPEDGRNGKEVNFRVLDEDSINAFAIPTGTIYLFTGLLDACETDDMLAGVMAHEMVHVFHKHHERMGERQLRGMLIGILAAIASGQGEGMILGDMVSASMIETYGRNAENDADATSVKWVVEAGYDPRGFLELMQLLEQEDIHRPSPGGNYFTVHPNPQAREENIRTALLEMGIELPRNLYRVHLAIEFYLPLTDEERELIAENSASTSQDGETENSAEVELGVNVDEVEQGVNVDEEVDKPDIGALLKRMEMFDSISPPDGLSYGVIVIGDEPVFYVTEESDEALLERVDGIIANLKVKFEEGLRNYDVQVRTLGGIPAVMGGLRRIIYTTESDAAMLGMTVDDVNRHRKDILKEILYRYEVGRKI